ncbi:MAG: ABC transporter permease [Gammaproteobacteria bacterium]|nr:ABC transporter permease [Gammaproteobacteria bacterium]
MIGCALGVVVGVFTGRVRLADRALGPIVHVLRSFPPVAIVPLAITWFGLAESSKYFLVFWGVFFPVWVNTHAGMAEVNKAYLWAARSLGAKRRHIVLEILVPASIPHILAGMRVAIGICFICVFVAEMAGAYEGVGFKISTSNLIFRVDRMLAYLLVLGAMVYVISDSGNPKALN